MKRPPILVMLIVAILLVEAVGAILTGRLMQVFVAVGTLGLALSPYAFGRMTGIRIPRTFLVLVALFVFATIYLGEKGNFYERFWWWDIMLHFGSAVTFGIMAFLFIFTMFEGDRYAAPPWALGVLSFAVAMAIGGIWEIFEYLVDQTFGTNMQKSGLDDTMQDLMVDFAGAALGGWGGYLYLYGRSIGGIGKLIGEFVGLNRRLYKRFRGVSNKT